MVKNDKKEQKNTSPPPVVDPSLARRSITDMAGKKNQNLYPNPNIDELDCDNNHEQNGDGEDLPDEGDENDESESHEIEDDSLLKEKVKSSHYGCYALGGIFLIVGIVAGIFVPNFVPFLNFFCTNNELPIGLQPVPVTDIITSLKDKFDEQPALLFKSVEKCLDKLNDPSAKEPCILLFLVDPKSNAVEKFKKEFAQIINIHPLLIEGNYMLNRDSDKIKLEIDNILNQTLSKSQQNFVIVNSLDKIPGQAALMFHSYCDHENAPFRNVIYMFFVTSDVQVPANIKIKALDGMAMNQIRKAWVDLNTDQLEPLLTRLTVRVLPMM